MTGEGEQAPAFCLPVGSEHRGVGPTDHLGGNVVTLWCYPGGFNPACEEVSTGLDERNLSGPSGDRAGGEADRSS